MNVNVQMQCNANNTAEAGINANRTVIDNNRNSDENFFSEQIREDDTKTNVKQSNKRNISNYS